MVNVKKIGAIATGALFIGATFGMASAAVTVPSGIASKLASGGVAKADLVVGADAPGKTADTEAAKEIQDAVKANLVGTVGGDISLTFGSQRMHDGADGNDNFNATTLSSTNESRLLHVWNTIPSLRYDGNSDGDLKDSPEDYTIYEDIYLIDSSAGDLQLTYQPDMDATYSRGNGLASGIETAHNGEVINIKGTKYVLTDNATTDGDFEIGPAITKNLGTAALDPDNAAVVTGTLKMLYDGTNLRLYDGKSLLDTVDVSSVGTNVKKLSSTEKTSDEFGPYDVYVVNQSTAAVKVAMVEKSQKFKVSDGEEGVLGYSSVKVGNTDFTTLNVTFMSDVQTMVKGDQVDLPDTYYQLKYTTAKSFDILRKKDSAITSGATVKSTVAPGKDFMGTGDKITMTVVGSDVQINFGSNNLHDSSGSEDMFVQVTLNSTYESKLMDDEVNGALFNSTNVLRYDGNSDGDLKDSPEDYTIYNDMYTVDASNGDVQLAFRPTLDATYKLYGNMYIEDANAGEVVLIKGSKYVLTDVDESDQDIEVGPAIVKTLGSSAVDPDNAAVVTGTLKMLYGNDGALKMYDGNSLLDSVSLNGTGVPKKLSSTEKTSDEYAPYDVYVINTTATAAWVSMVEKSQKFKITNDEEGILGYSKVKITDSDFTTNNVTFLSDVISMVKGDNVDVPDTYYQLKFTTAKGFDILRKKTSTISSGTKLKGSRAPGKDFLATTTTTVTVSTTGGAGESVPDIKVVDESTADTTGMNVVLIGGPVANTLTAELVENGKSKVNWYDSEGDIEVVSSAFTSGKYGIIVAGKERAQTADAAKALADSLA
jgi:hypothetical protein